MMRTIDVAGLDAPDAVSAGAVPELRWLRITDLVIDDAFQRPLEKHGLLAVKRIAAAFSWGKFAPVVASPVVGGRYSLIDGQHRTHAAALCGFDSVPAMVVVLTSGDQAASFAAINGNVTRITGFHVLKAALAAGEPWAVRSRDVVAEAGCRLMTYQPSAVLRGPREVYSIALIRRMVEQGRADVVRAGLAALAGLEAARAEHFSEAILRPWFMAIQSGSARILGADLGQFCAEHDLVQMQALAVRISKQPEFRGRTILDLTQAAYAATLAKWLGPDNLPVVVREGEDAVAARMAARAKADVAAQRRAGVA